MARRNALVISRGDGERRRLAEALEGAGLEVEACAADEDCLVKLEATRPALIVIDLERLDSETLALLRRLTHQPWRPVVTATVGSERESIEALLEGVDVCLSRRAGGGLVAAQAHALLRRGQRNGDLESGPGVLHAGGLKIDLDRFEVMVDGRTIPLTPTELRLVAALASRPGRVVGALQLLSECAITPLSESEARATAKVHIHRIRQKIAACGGNPSVVRNVRSFGYMLERRSAETRSAARARSEAAPRQRRSA